MSEALLEDCAPNGKPLHVASLHSNLQIDPQVNDCLQKGKRLIVMWQKKTPSRGFHLLQVNDQLSVTLVELLNWLPFSSWINLISLTPFSIFLGIWSGTNWVLPSTRAFRTTFKGFVSLARTHTLTYRGSSPNRRYPIIGPKKDLNQNGWTMFRTTSLFHQGVGILFR